MLPALENEGLSVHRVQRCYLCHGNGEPLYSDLRDRLFSAPGIWDIVRCTSCGLTWLDPIPYVEDIGKLYLAYYTHGTAESTFGYPRRIEEITRKAIHAVSVMAFGYADLMLPRRERIAGRLVGAIGPLRDVAGGSIMWLRAGTRGRFLDVGSGSGQFLAKMRTLGWHVYGVDPDVGAVHTAKQQFSIDSFHGTVEDADLAPDTFDAITMNHVIEHLYDPIETLRECARILKPGGRLVIVTPNTASLARRRFGEYWLAWDPPRHLHLFTHATLKHCVESAGLEIVHVRTSARIAGVQWRASTFLRDHKHYPGVTRPIRDLWPRSIAAMFQIGEHVLSRIFPVGEELVLIATRTVPDERPQAHTPIDEPAA